MVFIFVMQNLGIWGLVAAEVIFSSKVQYLEPPTPIFLFYLKF